MCCMLASVPSCVAIVCCWVLLSALCWYTSLVFAHFVYCSIIMEYNLGIPCSPAQYNWNDDQFIPPAVSSVVLVPTHAYTAWSALDYMHTLYVQACHEYMCVVRYRNTIYSITVYANYALSQTSIPNELMDCVNAWRVLHICPLRCDVRMYVGYYCERVCTMMLQY